MQKGTRMEMGTELLQAFAEYAEEARKITMEMNNQYHTFAEVRALFSKLTASNIDEGCILFPPFYTEFGKKYQTGEKRFYQCLLPFSGQRWH